MFARPHKASFGESLNLPVTDGNNLAKVFYNVTRDKSFTVGVPRSAAIGASLLISRRRGGSEAWYYGQSESGANRRDGIDAPLLPRRQRWYSDGRILKAAASRSHCAR